MPVDENPEKLPETPANPTAEGTRTRRKWQFVVASILALVGAFFGGVFGGLVGAFAGDSWWTHEVALSVFQYAVPFGGACLGAAPGMVWLLCLHQKWVLPFLGAAGFALLLPVFEWTSMDNDVMGLSYAGVVVLGFVIGLVSWLYGRRRA